MTTKIEWTEETWNMIRARNKKTGVVGHFCVHVSDGCRNCYAERLQQWPIGSDIRYLAQARKDVELFLDDDVLRHPLTWRRGREIFPCSMTDLFADFHPDEWIDSVLGVACLTPQHTYQCLTKRAKRMHEYFTLWPQGSGRVNHVFVAILHLLGHNEARGVERDRIVYQAQQATKIFPPLNWRQGVSAEDQKTADERVPLLLRTELPFRWVSFEPLLDEIVCPSAWLGQGGFPGLDWAVVGGESGPGARPCNISHVRRLVRHFTAVPVPVFVKQLGAKAFEIDEDPLHGRFNCAGKYQLRREWLNLKHSKGGNMAEWPEDLRVRQRPEVTS